MKIISLFEEYSIYCHSLFFVSVFKRLLKAVSVTSCSPQRKKFRNVITAHKNWLVFKDVNSVLNQTTSHNKDCYCLRTARIQLADTITKYSILTIGKGRTLKEYYEKR